MKRVLLILVPLLLVVGLGVGAAALGFVRVPFLPFGKKKAKVAAAPKDDGKGGPFAPVFGAVARVEKALPKPEAPKAPPPPKPDTSAGEAKLAGVWAEMPTDRLAALTERWPKDALGRILARMDGEAVTSLLAALPPERAAEVSRALAAATDEKAQKVRDDP